MGGEKHTKEIIFCKWLFKSLPIITVLKTNSGVSKPKKNHQKLKVSTNPLVINNIYTK